MLPGSIGNRLQIGMEGKGRLKESRKKSMEIVQVMFEVSHSVVSDSL